MHKPDAVEMEVDDDETVHPDAIELYSPRSSLSSSVSAADLVPWTTSAPLQLQLPAHVGLRSIQSTDPHESTLTAPASLLCPAHGRVPAPAELQVSILS